MDRMTLFRGGEDGYASYRIPALITLPSGRVIAFCEGRVESMEDYGTIRTVARISDDNGKNFGPLFVVAEDGGNTVGNPCPVYDRKTGVLHLLLNGNLREGGEDLILEGKAPRTVLYTKSFDEGKTWEKLTDLTGEVKASNWTWYAMGPCHAVQLKSGRLLIPCNHAVLNETPGMGMYISHAIYSDDHGATWKVGSDVGRLTNECSLAELDDGRIYINMRSYAGEGCRAVAYSSDGGETWKAFHQEHQLPDPICQGNVLAVKRNGKTELLFSNAADSKARVAMTVRSSQDDGKTWSAGTCLTEGPAAYSDLTELPDGKIACLFECGDTFRYERIDLAILQREEIC